MPMLHQDNYETITIDKRDNGVAIATLKRPEKLNAINDVIHTELSNLPQDVHQDPSVRVLVLTGACRGFCSGGDQSGGGRIGEWDGARGDVWTEARMIVDHLLECAKPIIASVHGPAAGLGANIALLCDVVVAGPAAGFADTHVRIGIGAGDGGQVAWPFLIGLSRAKYYLMTGEMIPADEACRMGLVTFLADDAWAKSMEIANRLAAGPPLAIQASKVPINTWLRAQAAQILPLSLSMEQLTAVSNDATEGRSAFQEKRTPNFTGT